MSTEPAWRRALARTLARLGLEDRYVCAAGLPGPLLELRSGALPREVSFGTGLFSFVPLIASWTELESDRLREHSLDLAREYSVRRIAKRLNHISGNWRTRMSLMEDYLRAIIHRATGAASTSNASSRTRLVQLKLRSQTIDLLYPAGVVSTGLLWEIFGEECYRIDPPVTRIYDFGANVGMSSLYFHLTHPGVQLICIEPLAENVRLLRRNIESNSVKAEIITAAAGILHGAAKLFFGDQSHALPSIYGRQPKSREVPVLPYDAIVTADSSYGIKIDVEGAEGDLSAFPSVILRARWIVGELHYTGDPEQEIRVDKLLHILQSSFDVLLGRPIVYFIGDEVVLCRSFRALSRQGHSPQFSTFQGDTD